MITVQFDDETAQQILVLAEKIKAARRDSKHSGLIRERNAFIDSHPELPVRELGRAMQRAGLYSPTTYLGDIVRAITNRREAKS